MNTRVFNNKLSGLSKKMDIILLTPFITIYNKKINDCKTIFISTRYKNLLIIKFIDQFLNLINHKVNVIIGGSDYTFPNNIEKRFVGYNIPKFKINILLNNKFINKIFVENLDSSLSKCYPIPLGINPKECPVNLDYFKKFIKININKKMKFTNFNRRRNSQGQWKDRGLVYKMCKNDWSDYFVETGHLEHKKYLSEMGNYLFTICVHGGGLDVNPKLFEALIIGVIPIIKKNEPYTNIYKKFDLPVVIIDDWKKENINLEKMNTWKNKYYKYFINKELRESLLRKLSLNFYVNYVSKI